MQPKSCLQCITAYHTVEAQSAQLQCVMTMMTHHYPAPSASACACTQELGLNYSTSGSGPSGSGRLSGRLSGGGGAPSSSGNSGSGNSGQATAAAAGAAAAVEAQVDAAMAVLYRLVAGWLLGPLALACVPALEAVAAFLHYLTVDDTAYA